MRKPLITASVVALVACATVGLAKAQELPNAFFDRHDAGDRTILQIGANHPVGEARGERRPCRFKRRD